MELYGFQQQLARLLTSVKQKESKVEELAVERQEEEAEIAELREQADKGTKGLEAKRAEVNPACCRNHRQFYISKKSGIPQTP